jgi:hypothetical protein
MIEATTTPVPLADDEELLFRQVHPSFVRDGRPSSQAFRPTPKDDRKLSVARGALTTPAASYEQRPASPFAHGPEIATFVRSVAPQDRIKVAGLDRVGQETAHPSGPPLPPLLLLPQPANESVPPAAAATVSASRIARSLPRPFLSRGRAPVMRCPHARAQPVEGERIPWRKPWKPIVPACARP